MAGNRIKGLTIEIGADTSDLSKSLKGIDSSLAKTKKELADVNKLLKLDPKNTELLKQKQDLLSKAIKDTGTRLSELKKAEEQLKGAGVDETSDEFKALRREIIDTENQLKSLNKQKFSDLNKSIEGVSKGFKDVGKNLTTYVTGPIMALGGASILAFNEVDKGLDIIIKKTGATGEALDGLADVMTEIATSIPATYEEAGEAIGEVATRFNLTGDALKELSATFIKFAKINDTTITASVEATQKALSAFGLGAEDAAGLLDALTKVSQNTGITVDTLAAGLAKNATAFKEMGLSIDESAALMGQIEKSGANVDTVLGGLSKALKNSVKDGKDFGTALAEIETAIKDDTDGVTGLQKAYDLFGKSGDQVYNAIKAGTLTFKDFTSTAEDAGGTVAGTFDAMVDPVDRLQVVMNQLTDVGAKLAEAVLPLLESAIETLTPMIQGLTEWWTSLDEDTQKFIVTAGLVVAAIGPIVTGIGAVIGVIGPMVTGIASAITAGGALSALLTGPLSIAIIGVITLGTALIANWDKVKEGAAILYQNVKTKFENIKKAISDAINAAKDAVKTAIDKIKSFFNFKWEWPKIKTPHFKVTGSLNPVDWFKNGVPKITIDWYAKGGIFNSPTIAGIGEAGAEAVLPLDSFYKRLEEIVTAKTVNNYVTVNATFTGATAANTKALARQVAAEITRELQTGSKSW